VHEDVVEEHSLNTLAGDLPQRAHDDAGVFMSTMK